MKTNQEISLKFWIAMIVFFAVVLSIPLIRYLIDQKVVTYDDVSAFYFVCFTSVSCFYMILVLRHSELKQKLSKETFFNKVSAQTITDYDNQIKAQESKINDLKQAFEDAVAEITELRSIFSISQDELRIAYERIEALNKGNKVLLESRDYWKERALHQKHSVKKEVDSDMWECISTEYDKLIFCLGTKYKVSNIISIGNSETLLGLVGNNGVSYLVFKSDFKPVKC